MGQDTKKPTNKKADGTLPARSERPPSPPPHRKISDIPKSLETKQNWKELFYDFISNLSIYSKELNGQQPLGEVLYAAQYRFVDEICEGLDAGVRHFVILKARQLGISTISLAIDLFWLLVHPGLQGALITDTEGNRDKFRIILQAYYESLPKELKVGVKGGGFGNRNNIVFNNGSVLDYLVAGVRKSGGGGLGRSRAYNFVHATECSSYGDEKGIDSLMASLAQKHPDRLYIFESTALGFNLFYNMWRSAKDDVSQKATFIGWWSKEDYTVESKSEVFKKYWTGHLSEEELATQKTVEEEYGHRITPNQWAWYRWHLETKMSSQDSMHAEYPSTEDEAFVATGRGFFPAKMVTENIKEIWNRSVAYEGYYYYLSDEFVKTEVKAAERKEEIDLKIWERPHERGFYVFGVDPAYGRDADNDRSVIQVFRCFADKMVQVAEYATSIPETHHLAWVLCHLAGNYKNCVINLELTGPGYAVMKELDHLKIMLRQGYLDRSFVQKEGLRDFFTRSRWYLYHRPDSMGAGYIYNWKTNSENKQTIMNQFRDLYMTKQIELYSVSLLEEMQCIVQDGYEIKGSGANKDDRVMAVALSCKAYIDWMRKQLIDTKRTQENELIVDANAKNPTRTFMQYIYNEHIDRQHKMRENAAIRASWDDDWGIVEPYNDEDGGYA
jgi:hypothetical protein